MRLSRDILGATEAPGTLPFELKVGAPGRTRLVGSRLWAHGGPLGRQDGWRGLLGQRHSGVVHSTAARPAAGCAPGPWPRLAQAPGSGPWPPWCVQVLEVLLDATAEYFFRKTQHLNWVSLGGLSSCESASKPASHTLRHCCAPLPPPFSHPPRASPPPPSFFFSCVHCPPGPHPTRCRWWRPLGTSTMPPPPPPTPTPPPLPRCR
jgi:hypothetical protein